MDRLLTTITGLSFGLIALILFSVRRAHIRVEYSVSWFVAAVALLLLSFSPAPLNWLATALGIAYAPVALLLIVFLVFSVVLFRFSVIISDLKDANIALAQRLAILEYRLHNEAQQTPDAR